jgi:isocitrate lyase
MKTYDHVALEKEWTTSERWRGIKRAYTAEDVHKLRGSVEIKHTLAERGSQRLWCRPD